MAIPEKRFVNVAATSLAILLAVVALPASALDKKTEAALDAAIAGEHRSVENKARDVSRQPKQVLDFFGFRSNMDVLEVWPGSGWYTQILAPALKDEGKLYAAQFDPNGRYGYQRRNYGKFLTMLGDTPDIYRDIVITQLALPYQLQMAPPESVDLVVTFRNVHNWFSDMYGSGAYAQAAFQAMYDALRPGGTLGIVDHRWPDPATEDPLAGNGYISTERTIAMAEAVGFRVAGESDMLANPKDTRDHPQGVWTLPPGYALGDEDREKYQAIGESDRFVLKFLKPIE